MIAGLRIDVDTYRGTRHGVPNLLDLLAAFDIHATFFFSVGPDNMGRHLGRLIRPAFLVKMLRSRAPGLYGWDILLRGTLGPGPRIGERLEWLIRRADREGHEVGIHAWDHHCWQIHAARMGLDEMRTHIGRGVHALGGILGRTPRCSAAPGWICTETALQAKAGFPFDYNSDCRGTAIFRPVIDGKPLNQPQIPVTLPTYDEAIGRSGVTRPNYNDHILSLLRPRGLNVLTIHAEVEGILCRDLFADFLDRAVSKGVTFRPLRALLPDSPAEIPWGRIQQDAIPGREGCVACQAAPPGATGDQTP